MFIAVLAGAKNHPNFLLTRHELCDVSLDSLLVFFSFVVRSALLFVDLLFLR